VRDKVIDSIKALYPCLHCSNGVMVIVLIAIAVAILIVVILIIKATKIPARDILGVEVHCVTYGTKTSGSKFPKCTKNNKTFGV